MKHHRIFIDKRAQRALELVGQLGHLTRTARGWVLNVCGTLALLVELAWESMDVGRWVVGEWVVAFERRVQRVGF